MPTLYHGTLVENLPQIYAQGIEQGEGWGGAGTTGVFLSGTPQGALYWAKMAHQRATGEKMEEHRFDRDHGHHADELIAVLAVEIPDDRTDDLKADLEQFEDVLVDFSPDDWKQSLEKIGDVRFNGPIPSDWVQGRIAPSIIEGKCRRSGNPF
jgi:hypothetical protein